MRAIYFNLSKEDVGATVSITGDQAHHLNVVRIKKNEDLLVLNGRGEVFQSQVLELSKHEILIKIQNYNFEKPKHKISLALALPKKDAFEDILKTAVELGVNKIYPLTSEYSQYEYIKSDRVQRLLESALIQSNNRYMPTILNQEKLEKFLDKIEEQVFYFSANTSFEKSTNTADDEMTILIGPEAGFSIVEEQKIRSNKKIKIIHLPTPILRSPTAVASSIGYLLNFNS